jgi:hypothetical protein
VAPLNHVTEELCVLLLNFWEKAATFRRLHKNVFYEFKCEIHLTKDRLTDRLQQSLKS